MINYFAYGSNLYLKQMQEVLNREKLAYEKAVLKDYELIFTDNCKASYANIKRKKGSKVIGLLYRLSEEDMTKLDYLESNGFGGYDRIKVKVYSNGESINAEAYVMSSNSCEKKMAFSYLATILYGLLNNDFDQNYIKEVIRKAEGVVV